MRTIAADSIGPFMESGRLSGTPKDIIPIPDDDGLCADCALCHGCRNWFDLDELIELEDGWYCEDCESKKED
jgi:hypothetical protein